MQDIESKEVISMYEPDLMKVMESKPLSGQMPSNEDKSSDNTENTKEENKK